MHPRAAGGWRTRGGKVSPHTSVLTAVTLRDLLKGDKHSSMELWTGVQVRLSTVRRKATEV
jgi:hypothetical protein